MVGRTGPEADPRAAPEQPARRWLLAVAVALLAVLLVRGLLVQPFSVVSTSMQPTLEPGERILVSRVHRGPSVSRGDVVVFDGDSAFAGTPRGGLLDQVLRSMASLLTVDTGTDYVKRVLGTPGDRVSCCDASGTVTVNGVPQHEPYLYPGDAASTTRFDVVVPTGRIWVMGDHRSESGDSRSRLGQPGGGMVALDDVIGTVWVRYWPVGRLGVLPRSTAEPDPPTPTGAGSSR